MCAYITQFGLIKRKRKKGTLTVLRNKKVRYHSRSGLLSQDITICVGFRWMQMLGFRS